MEQKHATPPADDKSATVPHIDTALIPDHVRLKLARATLDFVREIFQQPEVREKWEARKRQLEAEGRLPPR